MPLRALREPLEPLEPVSLRALRTFEGGFNALADLISYVLCQVAANMLIQMAISGVLKYSMKATPVISVQVLR